MNARQQPREAYREAYRQIRLNPNRRGDNLQAEISWIHRKGAFIGWINVDRLKQFHNKVYLQD